jgi:hypothetical protein
VKPSAEKVARTVLNGGMRKRTARQRALSLPNWNVAISPKKLRAIYSCLSRVAVRL